VDEMREAGVPIGALAIKTFRPWPIDDVREALAGARRVLVLEKAFAVGAGGIVAQNVRLALSGLPIDIRDAVAGLGGRPITKASLHALFADAIAGRLARFTFLDLDGDLVEREMARGRARRRSGPHAENMLRDRGIVAARPV
jgi:pyruvate ferredoxin oxidoreductase alpha subunit